MAIPIRLWEGFFLLEILAGRTWTRRIRCGHEVERVPAVGSGTGIGKPNLLRRIFGVTRLDSALNIASECKKLPDVQDGRTDRAIHHCSIANLVQRIAGCLLSTTYRVKRNNFMKQIAFGQKYCLDCRGYRNGFPKTVQKKRRESCASNAWRDRKGSSKREGCAGL